MMYCVVLSYGYGDSRQCYLCKNIGHTSRNCPDKASQEWHSYSTGKLGRMNNGGPEKPPQVVNIYVMLGDCFGHFSIM